MTLTLPLVVWSMWNSFSQVPDELVEAAIMDDASLWQAFLLIALPAARPGAVAAAILAFLVAWNDFFYALIITRTGTATAPVAVMNFISYDSVDWGLNRGGQHCAYAANPATYGDCKPLYRAVVVRRG